MVSISEYKRNRECYSQISSQHTLMVESNRKYMKILVDIFLYIRCQGIGFQGHDETKDSLNHGTCSGED